MLSFKKFINETSPYRLASYLHRAFGDYYERENSKRSSDSDRRYRNRSKGIQRALRLISKRDVRPGKDDEEYWIKDREHSQGHPGRIRTDLGEKKRKRGRDKVDQAFAKDFQDKRKKQRQKYGIKRIHLK